MKNVMVVAPHPDDETLGCGGTLLRLAAEGVQTHWVIMTKMTRGGGWTAAAMRRREGEIAAVRRALGFASVDALGFPAGGLDAVPLKETVAALSAAFTRVKPELLFVPGSQDAHSDHRSAFAACSAAAKSFRQPSLRKILMYETLSETDAGLPAAPAFQATSWCDISGQLDGKLAALALWGAEMGKHPFPRSTDSVRALATLRGAQAGVRYAEAFSVLRDRW